ncbi:hypothetical protein [Robertkochia aurantiaca]|uniref:hypothetical protein n=1 Tax=Robertkochia aurantiaca TaxID=2873700 RepID=UPI001CCE87BC|nr:hypothetical protein [Robertkochia sp. 3YJGBD-33]
MKWTNKQINIAILLAGLLVTVIGLVTGWYLFIFLYLPLGMLFRRNKNDRD